MPTEWQRSAFAEQSDKYAGNSLENDKDDGFMKSVHVLACTFLLLKWHEGRRPAGDPFCCSSTEESESL